MSTVLNVSTISLSRNYAKLLMNYESHATINARDLFIVGGHTRIHFLIPASPENLAGGGGGSWNHALFFSCARARNILYSGGGIMTSYK